MVNLSIYYFFEYLNCFIDFTESTNTPQYYTEDSNGSASNSSGKFSKLLFQQCLTNYYLGYLIEDVRTERRPGRPRSLASKLGKHYLAFSILVLWFLWSNNHKILHLCYYSTDYLNMHILI